MVRRELEFDDFDEVIADIEALQQGGYERVGEVGLGRTCEILSEAIDQSLRGAGTKDSWIQRLVAQYCLRRALKQRRMPDCFHLPQELESHQPDEEYPDAVGKYKTMIQRLRSTYEYPPHPTYGKLAPDVWEQMHLMHAAHRLSYLLPESGG